MKKSIFLASFLPLVSLLFGCGNNGPSPVQIFEGRELDSLLSITKGEESFKKAVESITYTRLTTYLAKTNSGRNFILLVHSSNQSDCGCWTTFRDSVLLPYVVEKQLNVYWIEPSEFSGKESLGLKINESYATLGVFENGKLVFTENTENHLSDWATKKATFASWMESSIDMSYMKAVYINSAQLEEKYTKTEEFTVDIGRMSCPDCSYFDVNDLHKYFVNEKPRNKIYVFDVDQKGVRFNESGEFDSTIWTQWKNDHGLVETKDNPGGYSTGMVPTLFHIKPNMGLKKDSVITGSAVIYNDTESLQQDGTYVLTDSYFTNERLSTVPLTYLRESNVSTKVLQGVNVGEGGDRHSRSSVYVYPIARAFLNAFIK